MLHYQYGMFLISVRDISLSRATPLCFCSSLSSSFEILVAEVPHAQLFPFLHFAYPAREPLCSRERKRGREG